MAEELILNIKANTGDATKNVGKLNDQLDDTSGKAKKAEADFSELGGQIDAVSGGAITRFKGLTKTIGGVSKGFKTMRAAIAATGLGLLVVVIASIVQAFKNSEKGQNKFAKLMAVIGSVVGNVTDVLSKFGMAIIEAFENPQKAVKDFADLIKNFVLERINRLTEGIGLIGSAIKKAFSGDFAGALEDTKDGLIKVNTAINPIAIGAEAVYNGIKKTAEATKDLVDEIARDAKIAADLADRRAAADVKDRELLVERAKANVEINKLKTKAAEVDKYTSEERIAFLTEAAKLEDEITGREVAQAAERLKIKQQENALSESTKEDLEEEAQLEAELIRLQEGRLIRNKELLGVAAGLRKMEADKAAAELKAQQDKEKAETEKAAAAEQARQDSIFKIQEEYRKKSEDAKADTELKKLNLERDRRLAELDALNATEAQKLELIGYYAEQEAAIKQQMDEQTAQQEEANRQMKIQGIADSLDAVRAAAGEETAIGKALFLAKAALQIKEQVLAAKATLQRILNSAAESGVDGAKGFMKAAAAAPPPANVPLIAIFAAQAAGIALSIKSAVSAAKSQIGASGGTVSTPAPPAQRAAPAFNVVGASAGNQIAEAIAGQEQKPVKAYVVSNDVTNQQALDRNITRTASLG